MVDAKAGQAGYGVSGRELLQADHTLALGVTQHVLIIGEPWPGEAHDKMALYVVRKHELAAHWTFYTYFFSGIMPLLIIVRIRRSKRLTHLYITALRSQIENNKKQ